MSAVVGREHEFAAVERLLSETRQGYAALILRGGPGIGKTTLWQAGIEAAREREIRVLFARGNEAEGHLSLAALSDLLEPVGEDVFAKLPAPQRFALEVALLRTEPGERPPEPRAIAAGFLSVLRELAAREPVLVALDDAHWLDPASAQALAFTARRLQDEAVGFLLAERPGTDSLVSRMLERQGSERLDIGALSFGATRRLLVERLALSPPRRSLRRIYETSGGNPLFVLELGRTLAEHGFPTIGEELPQVSMVEDLLGVRVARLSKRLRTVLLAVALSRDLLRSQLDALANPRTVDEALGAGLLLVEGDRVLPSHPLLAATARERSHRGEQKALHLALANVAFDERRRLRHLALAAEGPDASLAAALAEAGAQALSRGALEGAVELAEHALRLTPETNAERPERLLALADYLWKAGEPPRVAELLTGRADEVPPGAPRARFHLLLGTVSDLTAHEEHLERAWTESEDEPALRAVVLATKAEVLAVFRVERIQEAEAWAVEAHRLAAADPYVLYALGWCRILRGSSPEDSSTAAVAATYFESLERLTGIRLAFRGEIHNARATFARLLPLADERGEEESYAVLQLQLCELELRAGETAAASRLLDEWAEFSLARGHAYARCEALLAATRGLTDDAERLARAAFAASEAPGERWNVLESLRARGIAALLAHEPAQAAESLNAVWEHTRREGVDEPGAFPVAPDLVEALVELGEHAEALAVTSRLRELAEQQEHPWGLATARRCGALVRLAARSYDDDAAAELASVAVAYGELGLRFDRARTLLTLGRAQRRLKKWRAARESLEQAASAFDDLGSTGWAEAARSELARVGARRPRAAGALTEAERRAAELAIDGLSNKEIASALFVTVPTVEAHLSRAYAKLGVRSRTQLAGRLSADA